MANTLTRVKYRELLHMSLDKTRRKFLRLMGVVVMGGATLQSRRFRGFETAAKSVDASAGWKAVSDRKIRVGLVEKCERVEHRFAL
jgi:hypothetical protein